MSKLFIVKEGACRNAQKQFCNSAKPEERMT